MSERVLPEAIPGTIIDPPPKDETKVLDFVDSKHVAAGAVYRAIRRFSLTRATLLAGGTTYYLFLSLFALLAAAYGLIAVFGAERVADIVNDALESAFPGLTGSNGIDPDVLREAGQTTSLVGLLVLLYSGIGAMTAASSSLHMIYGAHPDPRNFVLAKLRLLGWLILLAPLALLSYIPSTLVTAFMDSVVDFFRITTGDAAWRVAFSVMAIILSTGINFLIVWLLLGHLGGIRPATRPRLIGAVLGAVGIEALKYVANLLIQWSLAKPQYGAFAAPITMMLVFYLQSIVVFGAASLTAGVALARRLPRANGDSDAEAAEGAGAAQDASSRADTPAPDAADAAEGAGADRP